MATPANGDQEISTTPKDITALHAQLDDLWIRYLSLLDDYSSAQAAIKKQMSAGFFSLAQANFKSPDRRYGQDFYDDRAVATTRAKFEQKGNSVAFRTVKLALNNNGDEDTSPDQPTDDSVVQAKSKDSAPTDMKTSTLLPTPDQTPEPEDLKSTEKSDEASQPGGDIHEKSKQTSSFASNPKNLPLNPHDPIRWFGILIPSPLRSAQASFASTFESEGSIEQAMNLARGMKETEVEIRKLRKLLKKAERETGVVTKTKENS